MAKALTSCQPCINQESQGVATARGHTLALLGLFYLRLIVATLTPASFVSLTTIEESSRGHTLALLGLFYLRPIIATPTPVSFVSSTTI